MTRIKKFLGCAALLLWFGVIGAGTLLLTDYANRPGRDANAKAAWPADTRLRPESGKPTLLLIGHPQCPCTRASIGELAQIMANRHRAVKVYVLFYQPPGMSDEWVKSDLWRSAAEIPGVAVEVDQGGLEARRFGAETSGQVFLYDRKNLLIFQGGITVARGHAGDNFGRHSIESYIDTGKLTVAKTPVFGCSLWNVPAL